MNLPGVITGPADDLMDESMSYGKGSFAAQADGEVGPEQVSIDFEGRQLQVPAGITVAAALLGHDQHHFCDSAADRDQRAPYCLMGVCFDCLVEIDGLGNRQACLETVAEGMRIRRQYPGKEEQT